MSSENGVFVEKTRCQIRQRCQPPIRYTGKIRDFGESAIENRHAHKVRPNRFAFRLFLRISHREDTTKAALKTTTEKKNMMLEYINITFL